MKIPDDKRFFRIGEVSRIIGVEPYVLRYWESEFPQIRPSRADSKQRTYQRKDVELIDEIRHLLYDEKMTIEGARQRLKKGTQCPVPSSSASPNNELLREVKEELKVILGLLS